MAKARITDQVGGRHTMILMDSDKPDIAQQSGLMSSEKRYSKVIKPADQTITPRPNHIQIPTSYLCINRTYGRRAFYRGERQVDNSDNPSQVEQGIKTKQPQ
ncbi:MAG: hypothetical protein JAY97_07225 [Candidatus Thiodiazotropha sp. 'RUGA']|nr:hypothetical protein [Candidatus Thiodiazotropha sp. 'RUGA']